MKSRYILAPQAARDLIEIWRYIKKQSSLEMAERVEAAIRDRIDGHRPSTFVAGESAQYLADRVARQRFVVDLCRDDRRPGRNIPRRTLPVVSEVFAQMPGVRIFRKKNVFWV